MKVKQIVFTDVNKAELLTAELPKMNDNQVLVRTAVSTISAGTERANLIGDANVSATSAPSVSFPRYTGYSSAGVVEAIGVNVKGLAVGDRVVVYWGQHKTHNQITQDRVVKINDPAVSFEDAAISFIATFPLAAIRKTRLEIGESALVMGLGILGMSAVKLLRAAGAVPIIAADPNPDRRALALRFGADYAFDPMEPDFAERVKQVTGGGVAVAIEVTGVGAGFNGALDCMAKFGRVALLGCTRDSDFTVDYYRKIHAPGITVIGAHTIARPDVESHPGWFTHRDDIKAVLDLMSGGRLTLSDMVGETHSPEACPAVYDRLAHDRNFPVVVQFDWKNVRVDE